jgi:hypothetical protein
MDVRIHVPAISCDGISEFVGDAVGTVGSGRGGVVTGCGTGWEVQPASTEVRITRVIKRPTGTELLLHKNILIPLCQDNYQASC